MNWTRPADIRNQVHKLWERGVLLASLAGGETVFPRRLVLKKPGSAELSARFQHVREWIAELDGAAKYYRLEWRTVNHRTLGSNKVPSAVWIDTLDQALAGIGKLQEGKRFADIVAVTENRRPELLSWLARRSIKALEMADNWPQILDIVDWLIEHPRPGVYLRQVDIPGVHSKFIEHNRGLLSELLDLVLLPDFIDTSARGVSGFCRRYGFRDKPVRIRFRILDPDLALPYGGSDQDITLTAEDFSQLNLAVDRVIITENEINFLAFPRIAKAMVLFGAGYGFDMLARAAWLKEREILYWGDIDTHGFAILDQLRLFFPDAVSFLMDRETLLTHKSLWGREDKPEGRILTRLTDEERMLYEDLCNNRFGEKLRLEQERVGFTLVMERISLSPC